MSKIPDSWNLGPLNIVTSKKSIDLVECSTVNLMEDMRPFRWRSRSSRTSWESSRMRSISSI